MAILIILILSSTASACVNPTDSFATEVLLNKPGISYNLSGMIGSDGAIVKTKEVPVESEHGGMPTPQAITIPENNSTVMTGTATREPVETRTELDRIIYRSHHNPDVAVILSEDQIPINGEWNDDRHLSNFKKSFCITLSIHFLHCSLISQKRRALNEKAHKRTFFDGVRQILSSTFVRKALDCQSK